MSLFDSMKKQEDVEKRVRASRKRELLRDAVLAGERKTMKEWALALYDDETKTAGVTHLLKRIRVIDGLYMAPLPDDVQNPGRGEGKVRLLTEKESAEDAIFYEERNDAQIMGRLESNWVFVLAVCGKYPELIGTVQTQMETLLGNIISFKQDRLYEATKRKLPSGASPHRENQA